METDGFFAAGTADRRAAAEAGEVLRGTGILLIHLRQGQWEAVQAAVAELARALDAFAQCVPAAPPTDQHLSAASAPPLDGSRVGELLAAAGYPVDDLEEGLTRGDVAALDNRPSSRRRGP